MESCQTEGVVENKKHFPRILRKYISWGSFSSEASLDTSNIDPLNPFNNNPVNAHTSSRIEWTYFMAK